MRRNMGFTLIEISIVIVIIGLLIAGVIQGKSLIQSAKVSSAITLAQDISVAVNTFKQQYHMLPGDMGITTEVPGISAGCQYTGGATNNGLIDTQQESKCVPEVLFKADLAKQPTFSSYYGAVAVIAVSQSHVTSGFSPSVRKSVV